jgi:hypothetical protein
MPLLSQTPFWPYAMASPTLLEIVKSNTRHAYAIDKLNTIERHLVLSRTRLRPCTIPDLRDP